MNDEDLICPFCHGTGKIKAQNCSTYYFDAQPVNMNIIYTFGNDIEKGKISL